MTKTASIRYDFLTNTLYVTKAYLDKAGVYGSPEYKEIKKYRDDNKDMKIEVIKRAAVKSNNRPVTASFADMEHHIGQFPQERQKELMDRYNKVKALSKTHRSPYKFVLDWFLDYFPCYNADAVEFDENNNPILKTRDDLKSEELENELKAEAEAAKAAIDDAARSADEKAA